MKPTPLKKFPISDLEIALLVSGKSTKTVNPFTLFVPEALIFESNNPLVFILFSLFFKAEALVKSDPWSLVLTASALFFIASFLIFMCFWRVFFASKYILMCKVLYLNILTGNIFNCY